MKILLVSYEFPPVGGGGSRVVAGLAGELAALGHDVDVVTMGWSERIPADTPTGVRLIETACTRRQMIATTPLELALYLPVLATTLATTLKAKRYDVCNVHFIYPDGLVAALIRYVLGRRYILTAHGSDVPGYNPDRFTTLHRLFRPLWRRIVEASDAVICPSPTLQKLFAAQNASARTTVIPNGFDVQRFSPDRERRRRVLVVTRLFRRKGVSTVVEAFREIESDYELHIVGDGPERPALERLAEGHPNIVLHGWIDNADPALRELYETASIFALLSEAENFPVCLLEAMASGLAVVTSADTGCADVVGDAGILVPAGDVGALKSALRELTAEPDLVGRLGRQARERVERHFTWKSVATDYLDLFAAGLNDPGLPAAATRRKPVAATNRGAE